MQQIGSVSETLRMKIEAARSRRERERALFPGVACLRCMDTGYMEFMGRQAPCHCERGVAIEQERQRAAWLERVEREVGVPETLRRDAAAGRYGKPLARQLRERIVDGGGVYLHGGTGRGKSVLASACLLQLVRSTGDVSVSPRSIGIFTTSAGYLQAIRDSYEQGGGGVGVSPDAIRPLGTPGTARVLVLDDIGLERLTEWGAEQIATLIDHRTSNGLVTIYTSNLTPEQLRVKYNRASLLMGDRIYSRIVGSCEVIRVEGKDWRVKQ